MNPTGGDYIPGSWTKEFEEKYEEEFLQRERKRMLKAMKIRTVIVRQFKSGRVVRLQSEWAKDPTIDEPKPVSFQEAVERGLMVRENPVPYVLEITPRFWEPSDPRFY